MKGFANIRKAIHRLSDKVDWICSVVTIVATIAFTLLIFGAVVSRYVFHFSIIFSVEISKLLFVWSAFLAATVTFKRKAHIRFEFMNMILGPRGIAITDTLLYASAILFFQLVLRYSVRFTQIVWRTYLPVLGVSQGWLYVAVIVSSVVFLIHALDLFLDSLAAMHDVALSAYRREKN